MVHMRYTPQTGENPARLALVDPNAAEKLDQHARFELGRLAIETYMQESALDFESGDVEAILEADTSDLPIQSIGKLLGWSPEYTIIDADTNLGLEFVDPGDGQDLIVEPMLLHARALVESLQDSTGDPEVDHLILAGSLTHWTPEFQVRQDHFGDNYLVEHVGVGAIDEDGKFEHIVTVVRSQHTPLNVA